MIKGREQEDQVGSACERKKGKEDGAGRASGLRAVLRVPAGPTVSC